MHVMNATAIGAFSSLGLEHGLPLSRNSYSNSKTMDEVAALEALANNLVLITENPWDLALHIQNVRLGRDTGMEDQVEAALDMVVTYWAAGDDVWIPLIDMKMKSVDLESAEGVQSVLDLFEKAEADYMCAYPFVYRT
jgi:hypothetical protein